MSSHPKHGNIDGSCSSVARDTDVINWRKMVGDGCLGRSIAIHDSVQDGGPFRQEGVSRGINHVDDLS